MPATLQSPSKPPKKAPLPPNIDQVILGDLSIQPWYSSFYPKEQLGPDKIDQLFVCPGCFKYTKELEKYTAHRNLCHYIQEGPVGASIYESNGYAIHEIDGEEHSLYAQNLSLFAKLFLDSKSVFFDVSSFLYYTLVSRNDGLNGQVVGFFSKEKMSWDNNNVACILVFPPWQKKGLGQILMGTSYKLGRAEGRFGGPERPLSTLGRRGYLSYWCGEVCRYLLQASAKRTATIESISDATWILPEDVVAALKEMGVHERKKTAAGNLVVSKSKVRAWADENGVSEQSPIDEAAFSSYHQHDSSESNEAYDKLT